MGERTSFEQHHTERGNARPAHTGRGNRRHAVRPLWVPIGLVVLLLLAFASGPFIGSGPYATDLTARYAPPSPTHLLGADHLGRDVLARVLTAGMLDVGIAVVSTIIALTLGVALGATSGYIGGVWDRVMMRGFDVWQSIPGLLFGLFVITVFGKGLVPLMAVISLSFVPMYARMIRSEILPQRRSPLVEAARLSGVPEWRILIVYLLPRHVTAAVAYLPIQAAFAMGMTAGLGFIGLGVTPSTPEWGAMISEGMSDLIFLGTWWTTLPAGLLLGMTSLILFQGGNWLSARFAGETFDSTLGGEDIATNESNATSLAHPRTERHI